MTPAPHRYRPTRHTPPGRAPTATADPSGSGPSRIAAGPAQSDLAQSDPLGSGLCHDPSGSGRCRAGSGRAAPGQATQATPTRILAVAVPLAALLIGAHLLAAAHGPTWTSPLLLGDRLFDLALAAALLLYALALGRRISGPLLNLADDPLLDALAALGLGLGAISLTILAAGFLHLYYPAVALLAIAALTASLRHDLAAALRDIWRAVPRIPVSGTAVRDTNALLARLPLLLVAMIALVALLDAALPPGWGSPDEWDSPAYHLAAVKLYLQAHSFVGLPDIPLATAPSGMEMLYTGGLLLGSDGMAKTLSTLFLALLGLTTFAIGRRHFGAQAGRLALALLATITWISVEAPAAFPDFASFTLLLLGVNDGVTWCASRHAVTASLSRRDALLIRAGLLIGIAVLLQAGQPARRASPRPHRRPARTVPRPPGSPADRLWLAARASAIICVAALLPLAPWLLKNLIAFHTMFYGIAVQTSTPTYGSVAVSAAATTTLGGHLVWIARNTLDIAWTSIGPLSPLLLLAPLLPLRSLLPLRPLLRWRQGTDQQPTRPSASGGALITFLAIAAVLWLAIVPRFVAPRYYVGPIAVAEILLGAVLATLLDAIPARWRRLAELPLTAYLLLALLLTLAVGAQQANRNQAVQYLAGSISRDDYLAARIRPYAAERWADAHLPAGAMVAMVAVTRGYYLDHPHLAEWYHGRRDRLEAGGTARTAELALWCSAGVRYAIQDRGSDELDTAADIRPLTPSPGPTCPASTSGCSSPCTASTCSPSPPAPHPRKYYCPRSPTIPTIAPYDCHTPPARRAGLRRALPLGPRRRREALLGDRPPPPRPRLRSPPDRAEVLGRPRRHPTRGRLATRHLPPPRPLRPRGHPHHRRSPRLRPRPAPRPAPPQRGPDRRLRLPLLPLVQRPRRRRNPPNPHPHHLARILGTLLALLSRPRQREHRPAGRAGHRPPLCGRDLPLPLHRAPHQRRRTPRPHHPRPRRHRRHRPCPLRSPHRGTRRYRLHRPPARP